MLKFFQFDKIIILLALGLLISGCLHSDPNIQLPDSVTPATPEVVTGPDPDIVDETNRIDIENNLMDVNSGAVDPCIPPGCP